MPNIVKNYLRAAPYIGTGGTIEPNAFAMLKKLGFKTVINLNTDREDAKEEGKAVKKAGLAYVSIAVATRAPDAAQVAAFSKYVNDPRHYPILVHCMSSNRVGAMWGFAASSTACPQRSP